MPLYDYKCTCGEKFSRLLPLDRYKEPQVCSCGQVAEKQLAAPRVLGDYAGYECPVTGRWIEGRAAHKENLARTGCRLLEPGETASAAKYRAQSDEQLLDAVANTAEQIVHEMPAVKREKLVAEIQSGVDVSITRL